MSELTVFKSDRTDRTERAIKLLEDTIEGIRENGCSHLSVLVSSEDGTTWHHDGVWEDVQMLIGGLEIAKNDALLQAHSDG